MDLPKVKGEAIPTEVIDISSPIETETLLNTEAGGRISSESDTSESTNTESNDEVFQENPMEFVYPMSESNIVIPPTSQTSTNHDIDVENSITHTFNPKPSFFQRLVIARDTETLKEYIHSPLRYMINDRDALGCSALHLALLNAYPDILEIILSPPIAEEPIRCVQDNGDENITDSESIDLATEQGGIIPIDLTTPYNGIPVIQLALCKSVFADRYEDSLRCLGLLLPYTLQNNNSSHTTQLDINAIDSSGATVLHLGCSFGDSRIVSVLLEYGALATLADHSGNQAVHYAISSRDPDTLSVILAHGGSDPLQTSTNTANLLKCCIDKAAWRCFYVLMSDLEYQQHPISESEYDLLSFHAQKLGLGDEFSKVFGLSVEVATNGEDSEFDNTDPNIVDGPMDGLVSTHIFTTNICSNHISLPEPIDLPIRRARIINRVRENPTRLDVLTTPNVGILRSNEFSTLQWTESTTSTLLADILRVHDWAYIRLLQHKIAESTLIWEKRPYSFGILDEDTGLSPGSWEAAIAASGAVINAVDAICRGENRNAFCAIRPPGHHMGTWGAAQSVGRDDGSPSGTQGFCLLNNIAIAAAYCRYMYASHGIGRIAIIDFDIHHGNGTEQIVRNIVPKDRHIKTRLNPCPGIELNFQQDISSYKIWRDETDSSNIFFSSIHAYDGTFYPGTGPEEYSTQPYICNVALPENTNSHIYRSKIKKSLLPKLLQFRPDIIFISAGFDAHFIDTIGKGFVACTENDFAWITQQLVSIANLCCNGRIVSVLEGGYNTKGLNLSPLAKSVAAHVRTLQWTSPNLMPNPQDWEDDEQLDISINYQEHEDVKVIGDRLVSEQKQAYNATTHNEVYNGESQNNCTDSSNTQQGTKRPRVEESSSQTSNCSSRPRRAAAIIAENRIHMKIQAELESKARYNIALKKSLDETVASTEENNYVVQDPDKSIDGDIKGEDN
ncbi:histone deacetylase [Cryptosporidium andersoni]|uniref:Histone deacetylase n=1 Tax=Cryptosporidium andersoni TaxID=117008 RepID=A0A1J4MSH1_9CRYT|nr:histone deacetylase [Cryptosporidium andersoni]